MEGTNWFRLSVIFAMFLGAIYVLLPTILQEDAQSRFAESAQNIDSFGEQKKAVLEVEFTVDQDDTEPIADILRERYALANVKIDRVVAQKGSIVVKMRPSTIRADVVDLATMLGHRVLYNPEDLVPSEDSVTEEADLSSLSEGVADALVSVEADLVLWSQWLPEMALDEVPKNTTALPTQVQKIAKDTLAVTLSEPLPEGVGFAILAVDDVVAGLVTPDRFVPLGKPLSGVGGFHIDAHTQVLLVSGRLPALLETVQAEQGKEDEGDELAQVEKAPSRLPTWLLGLLPDTRMNLGLDLQGGIDITLQVGLDDAVLSQATRDMLFVKERAAREGLNIHDVRRDRSEPIILLKTDENIDNLKNFVRKQLPDYIYVYSDENEHGFEMADARIAQVQKSAVEQVLETLRKRIDATGTKEPSIYKKGGGAINVQLPGETNLEVALAAIRTAAVLEFRMGIKDYDESILEKHVNAAEKTLAEEIFLDDAILNEWMWDEKRLDADRILLWEYEVQADGTKIRSPMPFVAENKVMLTGNDINDAMVSYDQNNQPYVRLEFKPRGGSVFCDISSAHVNEQFAIILDNELISAPVIRDRICGGVASIEMGASADPLTESNNLALVLRTGSLDAPVVIGNIRTVGSTLGEDSIRAGSLATIFGSVIVLFFMALWYGKAGMVADVALILNVMLAMAILGLFGATLTLPGIAGIALTIGMAVDANIIIYERIREELALGVHARKAVDTGFEKGLVAVLDANITTAIAGIVLFSYGTGPIKGFAVTLLVGIVTTLITALFVTRTFMDLLTRSSTARLRL